MAEKKAEKPVEGVAVQGEEPHVDKLIGYAVAQGHFGVRVDPTPLENYSVAGVLAGKPTPETDDKAADEARKAVAGF